MKQINMFEAPDEGEKLYTRKIDAPIYEPKNQKPHLLELLDDRKARRLISEIQESSIPEDEKRFLVEAARRHVVFNYEAIADYYSHSSPETQRLFERSALVIVDFDSAIENGYLALCKDLRDQFLEEYGGGENDE